MYRQFLLQAAIDFALDVLPHLDDCAMIGKLTSGVDERLPAPVTLLRLTVPRVLLTFPALYEEFHVLTSVFKDLDL